MNPHLVLENVMGLFGLHGVLEKHIEGKHIMPTFRSGRATMGAWGSSVWSIGGSER